MKTITVVTGLVLIFIGVLLFVGIIIMANLPNSKKEPMRVKILAFGSYGFISLVAIAMGIARLLGKF